MFKYDSRLSDGNGSIKDGTKLFSKVLSYMGCPLLYHDINSCSSILLPTRTKHSFEVLIYCISTDFCLLEEHRCIACDSDNFTDTC